VERERLNFRHALDPAIPLPYGNWCIQSILAAAIKIIHLMARPSPSTPGNLLMQVAFMGEFQLQPSKNNNIPTGKVGINHGKIL
jgi:hypothetical protein